jgi:hypothetical protein
VEAFNTLTIAVPSIYQLKPVDVEERFERWVAFTATTSWDNSWVVKTTPGLSVTGSCGFELITILFSKAWVAL